MDVCWNNHFLRKKIGIIQLKQPLINGCLRFQVVVWFVPGIPTTIKTMGVNITTIVYLRVLIIQIGSTIILMVVED